MTRMRIEQKLKGLLLMKYMSLKRTAFSLFLISFTFLAVWILGGITTFFFPPFIQRSIISLETFQHVSLVLLYVFSLFIPAVGLLFFINDIRKSSSSGILGYHFL
ncbi:MAG: hypothetical protein PWR29_1350 [Methanolobus sp.]|jgi:hypothetical protein|nr:hypothetical protein [Methanolobus sp.]MDK2912393.1 hypothetical protein [Methanolobus sp.]MDN5308627.1 hypothetical protein [Methanolobus sp.]